MSLNRKSLILAFVCLAYLADCIYRAPAMEAPFFLAGWYAHGRIAYIANAFVFLCECYAILGLWRLRKFAWFLALIISAGSIANSLLEVILPQGRAMIMQLGQEASATAIEAIRTATLKAAVYSTAEGLLIFLLLIAGQYFKDSSDHA